MAEKLLFATTVVWIFTSLAFALLRDRSPRTGRGLEVTR